jgi:DNA-binding transcriptional LysR family regulator
MQPNGWLGLEFRYFAALEAVVEEQSFGRAADRLGYTQSAVSQQIAALERIVGVRVVERSGGHRTVKLTDAGELLMRHAREIVAHVTAAQADLSAMSEGHGGVLRVGAFESVGARIVPPLLQRFRNSWPGVEVQLREEICDRDLQRRVAEGELDLAFSTLPPLDGPFEAAELLVDPYVLMVSAGSPLAKRARPPAAKELAALPLATFRQHSGALSEKDYLRAQGISASIAIQSDNNATIRGVVVRGMCAGLVPRLVVDPADPQTAMVELGDLLPPRVLGLVWHRERELPDVAASFIAVARVVSQDLRCAA